jgi:hypothetical protein
MIKVAYVLLPQAMYLQSSSGREARLFLPTVLSTMAQSTMAQSTMAQSTMAQSNTTTTTTTTTTSHVTSSSSQALNEAEAARSAFKEGWRSVPLHVFLPWVSQMLARLGGEEGGVLVEPLLELARR